MIKFIDNLVAYILVILGIICLLNNKVMDSIPIILIALYFQQESFNDKKK